MEKRRYEYQSTTVREYFAQGYEAGLKQGYEAGLKQGFAQGFAQGLRVAVCAFARARLGSLVPAYEAAIAGIQSSSELAALVTELGGARDEVQVHDVLERRLGVSAR